MIADVGEICKQSLKAYGGKATLKEKKTLISIDYLVLIAPPLPLSHTGVIPRVEGPVPKRSRLPVLPMIRKVYVSKLGHGSNIRLRVETVSEYGRKILLISDGRGSSTTIVNPRLQGAKDRVEPLPDDLVKGNLRAYARTTPLAFLTEFENRNAVYRGVIQSFCGLLEAERRDCHVLQFSGPDGEGTYELEIDAESMLCMKLRAPIGEMDGQTSIGESIYADYRGVDGIMNPYELKYVVDGGAVSVSRVVEVKYDIELSRRMFEVV